MRFILLLLALFGAGAQAQPAPARMQASDIEAQLDKAGKVELPGMGLVIERADFELAGSSVEAIITRPAADGKRAGLLLIAGHSRKAADLLPQMVRLARAGFATMAVSQPGYGKSTGPADFAGPRTFAALKTAAERFAGAPFVDADRMGVYGYSRGALAAAELAARTDLFKASVLGGGIYDFKSAHDQVALPGIKANMEAEAGLDDEAVKFRSPIEDVAGLDGPVLIVHGAEDRNAPLAQARALADRLKSVGREHELIVIPGRDHALSMADIILPAIEFFKRHLAAK